MQATPVIAIFDIGKTNKKLFLFDEDYQIVYEETIYLPEIRDEDEDACEDLNNLTSFVYASLQKVLQMSRYSIKAVNFSTYGASFVHLDEAGKPVTPLYSYLKPFPKELQQQFYKTYGGEEHFTVATASPVLGHLNSGMQLYWLKHHRPTVYQQINCSLHLPQYISYLLSNQRFSELTSIGCHTNLWNFTRNNYHDWVYKEGINNTLAPIVPSTQVAPSSTPGNNYCVGVGLHDSSAALIPYLASFQEPFVLLSTGTWCISLNPFNHSPLTYGELQKDCLCYLTYQGTPVKASRLFAGHQHEQQAKRLAAHFSKATDYYKAVQLDVNLLSASQAPMQKSERYKTDVLMTESIFEQRELSSFSSYEEAYHHLVQDIISQQVDSTSLVLKGTPVKRIFVDGGFSKNPIYMHLLAAAFPKVEVFAASVAQATAMGAALAIHTAWNRKHMPTDIIELKYYSVVQGV